jgi:hypothetical protein
MNSKNIHSNTIVLNSINGRIHSAYHPVYCGSRLHQWLLGKIVNCRAYPQPHDMEGLKLPSVGICTMLKVPGFGYQSSREPSNSKRKI